MIKQRIGAETYDCKRDFVYPLYSPFAGEVIFDYSVNFFNVFKRSADKQFCKIERFLLFFCGKLIKF